MQQKPKYHLFHQIHGRLGVQALGVDKRISIVANSRACFVLGHSEVTHEADTLERHELT